MAYVYYNPNPYQRRGIGDCTIRCLAKALNTSWDSAYIELASQGFFLKDMPSSNVEKKISEISFKPTKKKTNEED